MCVGTDMYKAFCSRMIGFQTRNSSTTILEILKFKMSQVTIHWCRQRTSFLVTFFLCLLPHTQFKLIQKNNWKGNTIEMLDKHSLKFLKLIYIQYFSNNMFWNRMIWRHCMYVNASCLPKSHCLLRLVQTSSASPYTSGMQLLCVFLWVLFSLFMKAIVLWSKHTLPV